YICAILLLIGFNIWAQKSIEDDPEIIQNSIDYHISQSELDIANFDYFEAQKKLDDALELAIKAENNTSIGIIYSKKGKLHLIIEEQDEAIKSLNEAIKAQRSNDNANLGNSYKTLGEVYLSKKDYNQAIDYFVSAKNLFLQESLNKNIAETLVLEGTTYLSLENHKKARELFDQSIQLAKKENLPRVESSALIKQASVFTFLGDNGKAIQLANEGLNIAKANKFPDIISEGYAVLSDATQNIGDYKTSNDYLRAFIKLSDSLRAVKKANLSPEKRIQSLISDQIEKTKRTEDQLEEANNKNDLSTLISILSVALITILSLLTLSLYKNNNIRLKTNNMLHKKNAELIIAKEKAELASKTKANFLSTVTHELR